MEENITMKETTGIALVTYKRFDYFKQVVMSLVNNNLGGADYLVVVQDGDFYTEEDWQEMSQLFKGTETTVIILDKNRGVATAKNEGIKQLLNLDCTHIFTLEDDILIQSPNVCQEYVDYAKKIGVKHLNFALHGEMNKGRERYYHGVKVYPHCVGAWSYYHKVVFDEVGFFDENMINAFEHVYHTLKCANSGLTFPFWLFPDHPENDKLLKEIPGSIDNSSIRPRDDWQSNIREAQAFMVKEQGGVFLPQVPDFWRS